MKSALYLSIAIILLLVISVRGSPAVTINAQQATQTPTSEAPSESTVEATASVTAEATSQATSEATAQATANPTSAATTPAPQATAEATADQDGMTMNAPSLDSAESIAFCGLPTPHQMPVRWISTYRSGQFTSAHEYGVRSGFPDDRCP
ncbi:MAG: hypothetical protein U0528_03215 [Anaerolineae bacterium]